MDTQCSVCHQAAARFFCSCVTPPLPVCAGCLGPHAETVGEHVATPIPKKSAAPGILQEQGNQLCDVCHEKIAVCFCVCAVPLRKFCSDCCDAHYKKNRLLAHSEHPIEAFAMVASGRVPLEIFKKKQLFINDLSLKIDQEIVNFDAFVNKVGEEFDVLLGYLTEKREEMMRNLQAQRTNLARVVHEAKQEIEAKRYGEAFAVRTQLDEVLLNGYKSSALPDISVFSGRVNLRGMQEMLKKSITWEVASKLTFQGGKSEALAESSTVVQLIPVIKGDSLRLYHPETLAVTTNTLGQTTRIDKSTAYCYIRENVLLCCGGGYGGGEVHANVYEIDVATRAVMTVGAMCSARAYPGICKYKNDNVFAFGGYFNDRLKSAEKYGLTVKSWTSIRNSLNIEKDMCLVCEHGSSLYISGFKTGGSSIEHFNPQSQVFTLLMSDDISYYPIICSDGANLYLIRNDRIEVANLANGPTAATFALKATIPPIRGGNYWMSCSLKWHKGELTSVLSLACELVGLFRFSPAKSQFTKVIAFNY